MKRFFLFAYDESFPSGGFHDMAGSYETEAEAREIASELDDECVEMMDVVTGEKWVLR